MRQGYGYGERREGRRGRRLFDYGELRLLILAMIAERPRHGYQIIKAIEDRFAGAYSPSPGVVYPTLAWLEDMGYARIEPEAAGRRLCRITPAGIAFLDDNRAQADELLARRPPAEGEEPCAPAPILRAMENVKFALRLRLRGGGLEEAAIESIAAALDAAARAIEKSR